MRDAPRPNRSASREISGGTFTLELSGSMRESNTAVSPPAACELLSLDRQYGSFSWSHNLTKRYFFTQIDTIKRDTIRLIDYRGSSLNALGVRLKGRRWRSVSEAVLRSVDERKNTPLDDGLRFQLGTFYSLVYNIDPHWQLNPLGDLSEQCQVAV